MQENETKPFNIYRSSSPFSKVDKQFVIALIDFE